MWHSDFFFLSFSTRAIEDLQEILEEEEINGTSSSIISDTVVALQYKPNGTFRGLDIYASDNQVFKK